MQLTSVIMSCKYLNGGRCNNLSVNGGLVIILPSVALVFFKAAGLTPVSFSAITLL